MTDYLPIGDYRTPRDRKIRARLSDGSYAVVSWNPLAQEWQNEDGKRVVPFEWQEIDDG